jgi:hypothetical protein
MMLAMLAAVAIQTADPSGTDRVIQAWADCAIGAASRMALLDETPTDIAEGAIGLCAGEAERFRAVVLRLRDGAGRPMFSGAEAQQMVDGLYSNWRPRLVAMILQLRGGAPNADGVNMGR